MNDRKLVVKGLKGKDVVRTGIDTLKDHWQRPFKRLMHEEDQGHHTPHRGD
jgi:hypothetical protein